MNWDSRQARCTLVLFLLILAAGQVNTCLKRPIYPDRNDTGGIWPPEGHLVDATALDNRALEVFPSGTDVGTAVREMGIKVDPLGSGRCLPRAGVLDQGKDGWSVRSMSQRERWVWRIPMDLNRCEPDDFQRIKGIGPSLAGRIYRFVQGRGSLRSLSELGKVPGIGPHKLKVLKRELTLY